MKNLGLSLEKFFYQFITSDVEMGRNLGKDACNSADSKGVCAGDRNMVFAMLRRGQAHMAAGLTGNLISKDSKGFGEFAAR